MMFPSIFAGSWTQSANVRRRGYAAQVVTAWAATVRDIGRVPLYSTPWQNEASLAVAHRLSLLKFGSDLHLT
jgi:predicted GNAT family acetyltransferase